ncbi:LysR family transcriptional regulator [Actinoalloteichus hymeniacidonis]|uniref:Transcriptional regulator n=1 Tax=Actinoalloteichus hymeniacidonis TaxID=340345 RepID=A0AAC9HNB3_9PSEU|nr:LysR family transcriptional regulator [Actinoalloteichus hymeniacidonis]AOS62349.1 transcriptional regulator [Actinoalloteichus hymeniacidonis]MBB5909623.1 DNA-binding transcriptional LysR family regulator [Actinoalloteichus hymeniacidonis]
MSEFNPLRFPSASGRSRLLQSPPPLLDTTLDQLRTLLAVREVGTALGAARMLGREQSSVQKQLDTMNRNFSVLCGEPLVLKQGRGKDMLFTGTGESLVEMARRTLAGWLDEIDECRRSLGGILTVATTRFTLRYLADAGRFVAAEFESRGIELKVVHVRSGDLFGRLRAKQVDLVCGSLVTRTDDVDELADLDVMAWRRSGLSLVTNLPPEILPDEPIRTSDLPMLPLVVPSYGLITDFLRGWFGPEYLLRLEIAAEIDTVHYGFELLRSQLTRGCMLVTQGIGEAAAQGRLPEGDNLRTIELVDDVAPGLQVLAGLFARRDERAAYPDDHPLNLMWSAFARQDIQYKRRRTDTDTGSEDAG